MLYGNDPRNYRLAYQATTSDELTDGRGPLIGWGYSAVCRRLLLIQQGLVP
jgi:hypothetical protein